MVLGSGLVVGIPTLKSGFLKNTMEVGRVLIHTTFLHYTTTKKAGFVNGDLLHYTYANVEELQNQTNYFAEIAGKDLFLRKGKPNVIRLIVNPLVKFLKYIFS